MKQTINGKRYNTDTAKCIGSYEAYKDRKDLWRLERLYQKVTGEFFLYGEGGKLTRYSEFKQTPNGKIRRGIKKLIPLSFHQAKAWAEQHLSDKDYHALFDEVTIIPKKNNKQSVTFLVEQPLIKAVDDLAKKQQQNRSEMLTHIIRIGLEQVTNERMTD